MRDLEIRLSLRQRLVQEYGADSTALILDELGLCCGRIRADMAVINGQLKGFEIKSDEDTLSRLRSQAPAYGRVFDTATIVVGPRHLQKAVRIVPRWWGVFVADGKSDKTCQLECIRKESANPSPDAFALVQLIWRDEAFALLRAHDLDVGLRNKPRKFLWQALVDNFELQELQEMVRAQLKTRKGWRSVGSRVQCDVMSRPSSMSSGFQNSRASEHSRLCTGHPN